MRKLCLLIVALIGFNSTLVLATYDPDEEKPEDKYEDYSGKDFPGGGEDSSGGGTTTTPEPTTTTTTPPEITGPDGTYGGYVPDPVVGGYSPPPAPIPDSGRTPGSTPPGTGRPDDPGKLENRYPPPRSCEVDCPYDEGKYRGGG